MLTLLNTLDQNDKQRIMLTLVLPENSQKNAWEDVQQGLFSIQRVGIQKFGIDGYDFEKSKDVHQYLYNPLSLNASPVMYQPFAGLVEGKSNEGITRYSVCFCLFISLLMAWTWMVGDFGFL